ncbi:MAG: aspartyl/glutamyl-tRNA amidotransferase subunit C [Tenericutes bacterium]|jgi:aspartyl/glutamyl-tRNA(Asn/Gln) amidotransferase C subunit|nr:aspartyl/glutamyl-tRNA amidotransferase subunit C [Bacilli bacterium]MDD3995851.1 aspartyl/glutamyl-tRNA amidotransferase subunit C [Bacilli bacterium]NLV90753.1 aspartyl/glutamyl-tRNA amidotransferase subunit C [Mycoplasmatota bacterium]
MYKLSNEQIMHVADLAKLHMNDLDIEKYRKDLDEILNNIETIESLNINEEIMISPSNNFNVFSNKEEEDKVDVLINVKNRAGDFIKVEVENE